MPDSQTESPLSKSNVIKIAGFFYVRQDSLLLAIKKGYLIVLG